MSLRSLLPAPSVSPTDAATAVRRLLAERGGASPTRDDGAWPAPLDDDARLLLEWLAHPPARRG